MDHPNAVTEDRLRAAFEEGWREGERFGGDQAHPLATRRNGGKALTDAWEWSDTRQEFLKAKP